MIKRFNNQKKADIYLKAAKNIDGNIGKHKGYCCHALRDLGGFASWIECEYYFPEFWSFRPEYSQREGRIGWWSDESDESDESGKSERVLALLFAYWMVKL